MMGKLIYLEKPNLEAPTLIVGFEGWPNAAEVSSSALQYLVEHTKAVRFASMSAENFYLLSSARPVGVIKEGRLTELKPPGNDFYAVAGGPAGDFIFFSGVEPHLRWTAFAALLLDLAETFQAAQLITVGGTYDYVPHTRPPVVSALFNHEDLRDRLLQAGLALTEYTGPISMHTFLLEAARERGLKGLSLWGHAPQYLQTKNVRVVAAVLGRLSDLIGLKLDLSELQRAGDYFDQQVNQFVEQDPKLKEVIGKLEEVYKRSGRAPVAPKREDGEKDDKVVYIQAFLKRQEDEEKKGG